MKKETENLIYSLQSGLCASRGSIKEAHDEVLQVIKDELPPEVKGIMYIRVQILLNSIVSEVMATEHKQPTEGKKEYISKEDYVPASILSASDYDLRVIVGREEYSSTYRELCNQEMIKRGVTL